MSPAAVFDLDGTLVETLPDLHGALVTLCREEALEPPRPDQVRRMIGDGVRMLVARALMAAGRSLADGELDRLHRRFLEIYEARPYAESYPLPGAREVLEALRERGMRLAVCTNKPQQASEAILEAFGLLPLLDLVVGGDVLPVRKPDPGHLGAVLRGLGASPEASVMVGDSRNDLAAARGLGVPVVLLREGYGADARDALDPDRWITDLRELPKALAALGVLAE